MLISLLFSYSDFFFCHCWCCFLYQKVAAVKLLRNSRHNSQTANQCFFEKHLFRHLGCPHHCVKKSQILNLKKNEKNIKFQILSDFRKWKISDFEMIKKWKKNKNLRFRDGSGRKKSQNLRFFSKWKISDFERLKY